MSELEGIINFLKIAGRLKKETRKGWIIKAAITNPESVSDHTFRVSLLAMIIGDMKGLDTEKMIKMALIHDLSESLTGDFTPLDKNNISKLKITEEAIKKILYNLPNKLRSKYSDIWTELSEKSSEEAKLVSELDKLEMALQARAYADEGYSQENLKEFNISALKGLTDSLIIELFNLI